MSTKLFLSIAVRALLFLRMMTSHGFTLSNHNNNNAILLQQWIKQPLKPLFVTSSISSLSSSSPYSQQHVDDDDDLNMIESSTLRQLYPKLVAWKKEYGNPNIPLNIEGGRQCQLLRRLHIQQKLRPNDIELLRQLYPKLVAWKKEYGNPNIPLNIEGGRQCQLLRRLHIQQKLRPNEIELLENLDFNLKISLEDLYYEADFEDMYARLTEYQLRYPNDPVTKKYRSDPELGAWATGLRRLGTEAVQPEHVLRLNAINFNWKSKRSCGSKFMLEYRDIEDKVRIYGTDYLQTSKVQNGYRKNDPIDSNIPLNSEGGRQCQLVRRLHIQQKLRPGEIELLENLGFIFLLTLEDLYYEADFDDMYNRISNYQRLHPNDSIPKKYRPDPELGAWATGLRRLGPDNVRPEHVQKLAQINFQWKSSSPCGSKFMLEFRDLVEKVRLYGRDYLDTEDVQKWISKERSNRLNDKMNDTRYHYMVELIGTNWMEEE
eukprot:CAMPEP_0194160306 /NCGR_PEP_ID=MMETSP0152-20130528/78317_1 /TAXON_ID=1049557 /ORGANISM="Thalassiothrix antarctica, Strain L6-D1" /LENGTH=487 /DNA_ID=CAMNT_0038869981 /DNA_START=118 /DNA_END=1581 /DNA_ORIENTATION=-